MTRGLGNDSRGMIECGVAKPILTSMKESEGIQ